MKDTLATLDLTENPGQRITTFRHVRHYQQDGPVETEPGERIFSSGPQHGFYSYTIEKEEEMGHYDEVRERIEVRDKHIHDACIVDAKAGETPARAYDKARLLDEAKATVAGRGKNYGTPEDNFGRIAAHWNAFFINRHQTDQYTQDGDFLSAGDVAMMMALMKIARLENDPKHADSWIDLAGYAACGAEIETAA